MFYKESLIFSFFLVLTNYFLYQVNNNNNKAIHTLIFFFIMTNDVDESVTTSVELSTKLFDGQLVL